MQNKTVKKINGEIVLSALHWPAIIKIPFLSEYRFVHKTTVLRVADWLLYLNRC